MIHKTARFKKHKLYYDTHSKTMEEIIMENKSLTDVDSRKLAKTLSEALQYTLIYTTESENDHPFDGYPISIITAMASDFTNSSYEKVYESILSHMEKIAEGRITYTSETLNTVLLMSELLEEADGFISEYFLRVKDLLIDIHNHFIFVEDNNISETLLGSKMDLRKYTRSEYENIKQQHIAEKQAIRKAKAEMRKAEREAKQLVEDIGATKISDMEKSIKRHPSNQEKIEEEDLVF